MKIIRVESRQLGLSNRNFGDQLADLEVSVKITLTRERGTVGKQSETDGGNHLVNTPRSRKDNTSAFFGPTVEKSHAIEPLDLTWTSLTPSGT